MTLIILVGLPGSGKTTLLKEVLKARPTLQIVNYGDQMLQAASANNVTRDELRKLPTAQQEAIGLEAAQAIAQSAQSPTIVDTHALIRSPDGFVPGLPDPVMEVLQPKAIALLEAPPEAILKRRAGDSSRVRDQESADEIAHHQECNRAFLEKLCAKWGCILSPVDSSHSLLSLID